MCLRAESYEISWNGRVPVAGGGDTCALPERCAARGILVQAEGLHPVKGIADTGFLVAFANRSDQHHEWAVSVAERVEPPLLTCEAVLAESAFHLRNAAIVLAMLNEGLVRVALDVAAERAALATLARRYADRQPDLADLCLIRLSELYARHPVITVDEADFRVYRRHRRDAIPLLCPPRAS